MKSKFVLLLLLLLVGLFTMCKNKAVDVSSFDNVSFDTSKGFLAQTGSFTTFIGTFTVMTLGTQLFGSKWM